MRTLGDRYPVEKIQETLHGNLPVSYFDVHPMLETEIVVEFFGADGEILERRSLGPNVITNQGRSNMAHLLAGDETANRIVSTMKFGDGGHNPSSPTEALPTAATDTALYGAVILTKTVSYEFPDGASANKVAFTATIGVAEGNGAGAQAYSEVGLFDVTGRLMAHKTFGLITKSNAFGISFKYSILF